jgi:AcrR family transcriptional regulator
MTDGQEARRAEEPLTLRERNRLRTRRELLDAALRVFDERGFAGSTVEAIAAAAGASKVTLYAYFPSGRDGLFRELYEEINAELLELAHSSHAAASGLVDGVVALCRPLLDIGARPIVGRFYSNTDPSAEPALVPVRGHASRVYARLIAEDVAEARASGLVDPGVEPETVAALLVGATRAALVEVSTDPSRSDRLLAGIVALTAGLLRRQV